MTRFRDWTSTRLLFRKNDKDGNTGYVPYRGRVSDPLSFCRALFPPAPIRSKADSFNLSALFWLLLGLSIIPMWVFAIDKDVQRRQTRSHAVRPGASAVVTSLAPTAFSFRGATSVPVVTPTPVVTSTPVVTPTSVITPTAAVPTPTPMPTPIILGYSYYWPPLGGVNCRLLQDGTCSPYMASGQLWRDWVGRAVAVGFEMLDRMPIGSCWLRNTDGKQFFVQDICPACGDRYIDFLSPRQEYPWGAPIGFYPCKED